MKRITTPAGAVIEYQEQGHISDSFVPLEGKSIEKRLEQIENDLIDIRIALNIPRPTDK